MPTWASARATQPIETTIRSVPRPDGFSRYRTVHLRSPARTLLFELSRSPMRGSSLRPAMAQHAAVEFDDLKQQCVALRECERREEARLRRSLAPGMVTLARVKLAAYGRDSNPIGSARQSRILVDSTTWAPLIRAAARAFRRCPGLTILDVHPLPDVGCGFVAGRRVLEFASTASSAVAVAAYLDAARKALGPWTGEWRGNFPRTENCEVGIWDFFRQLHRYWTGSSWQPPVVPPRARPGIQSIAQSAALASQGSDPEFVRLSRSSQAVLDSLRGECLSAKEIAMKLRGNPRRAGSVRYSISQLRAAGIRVEHDRALGYWLPSEPPAQLSAQRFQR